MDVNQRWRAVGPEELEGVDHRHALDVQHRSLVADLEVDGGFADVECPEESRGENAAVEVVQLRPRTGVIEVDSYQRERSAPDGAIDDVLALESTDVGFEVVDPAVAAACPTDVVGERG